MKTFLQIDSGRFINMDTVYQIKIIDQNKDRYRLIFINDRWNDLEIISAELTYYLKNNSTKR